MELFSDPDDNRTLEWFKEKVAGFLDCQFCVKGWHNAKKQIRRNYERWPSSADEAFRSEYAPEILDNFIANIDVWDYQRIYATLSKTEASLRTRQASESALKFIDNRVYVSIYDCMFVPHLLLSHDDLSRAFITTFSAIQEGGRHMGMAEAIPALAAFLFMNPSVLRDWAVKCLQRMNKPINAADYDNWLQPYVEKAINSEALRLDPSYATRMWRGLSVLLEALDKTVIVERIAGSDYDIFRLVVSHLQGQTPNLLPILSALKVLLTKTEYDFWEAVSSMPPIVSLGTKNNNSAILSFR
ncbi:hypothetical protein ABW19_dt0209544 [Dactylella cylindrospora]|nr:hypothetical protein ABW19_dt0209544 [Dactylella cylindrospora]